MINMADHHHIEASVSQCLAQPTVTRAESQQARAMDTNRFHAEFAQHGVNEPFDLPSLPSDRQQIR